MRIPACHTELSNGTVGKSGRRGARDQHVSSMSVGRNFVALAAVLITLLFGTAVAAVAAENTTKPISCCS
jgi:hypothetical protein